MQFAFLIQILVAMPASAGKALDALVKRNTRKENKMKVAEVMAAMKRDPEKLHELTVVTIVHLYQSRKF